MLLYIVLPELTGDRPVDILMRYRAQVGTTVCFNDDQVAFVDLETGAFLNIVELGSCSLECDEIEVLREVWRLLAKMRHLRTSRVEDGRQSMS
jgi:hypothetical protein